MIEFLIFGLLALTVICLWILIEGRKNPKFLVWFIPVILVLVSSTYLTYTSILGYPKSGMPKEGVYLHHYIDEPNWIYLWMIESDNKPRSYKIEFDRKTQESLEGVRTESEQGNFMILKDVGRISANGEGEEESGRGYTIGGDKQFYIWKYESEMIQKK
tara:strand:+ start:2351 stop:2827 length:477 start_codon:yes stop_codon:yes gene_type:complete